MEEARSTPKLYGSLDQTELCGDTGKQGDYVMMKVFECFLVAYLTSSNEDRQREEELLQQIQKLVETRDFLVDDMEFERLRSREEDKEMADFLQTKIPNRCSMKSHNKDKRMTSRAQQTSSPYVTKTGVTLLKECCGFTCSIM
uniref:BMERB domain-containing protein n=1 Tax=Sinocyclocheilus rhinocerous TaxID=307959 RepID=A0A673LW80_9TELE